MAFGKHGALYCAPADERVKILGALRRHRLWLVEGGKRRSSLWIVRIQLLLPTDVLDKLILLIFLLAVVLIQLQFALFGLRCYQLRDYTACNDTHTGNDPKPKPPRLVGNEVPTTICGLGIDKFILGKS